MEKRDGIYIKQSLCTEKIIKIFIMTTFGTNAIPLTTILDFKRIVYTIDKDKPKMCPYREIVG